MLSSLLIITLVILDIIHVIRDKDPVFWQKQWFQITAGVAALTVVFLGIILPIALQARPETRISYIGEALAANGAPVSPPLSQGSILEIRYLLSVFGITLLLIAFCLSAYVTFFIDQTDSNAKRIGFASDIFKTILGFLTGVLTAVLNK